MLYKPEHYKVYYVRNRDRAVPAVTLEDQFGPRRASIIGIEFFANPVKKNGEDIIDEKTHLTWYGINEPPPHVRREVRFSNQFETRQTWIIGRPVYLLVPTDKNVEGSRFESDRVGRDETKHFKCYEVLHVVEGTSVVGRGVTLEDQFDDPRRISRRVTVGNAMYFCTPVKKNNEGDIDLEGIHLACYQISSEDVSRSVNTRSQFGDHVVYVQKSFMLCVPSNKKEVRELGEL